MILISAKIKIFRSQTLMDILVLRSGFPLQSFPGRLTDCSENGLPEKDFRCTPGYQSFRILLAKFSHFLDLFSNFE